MKLRAKWPLSKRPGLAYSYETEADYTSPLGSRPIAAQVLQYELTDNGATFYRENDASPWAGGNMRTTAAWDNNLRQNGGAEFSLLYV